MSQRGRQVPRDVRHHVFAHDRWRCRTCGTTMDLTVDHMVPRARGGNNYWRNLQTLCGACNQAKGDRLAA